MPTIKFKQAIIPALLKLGNCTVIYDVIDYETYLGWEVIVNTDLDIFVAIKTAT